LSRSLQSLKLMFLDIEAEISAPVIEDDQDTVLMTLETICYKLMEKTKRKRTSSKKLQRCGKKIHIDKPPLLPSRGNAPPTHAQAPIPLSTDLTLQDMMIRNIEALKYQCSRTLTTEDFMKFIFANRHIEARFHKYITTIMAQKEDGDKYVALEQEIGHRRTLMDKIQQLPKPGETFLLPTFDKNVFIAPYSKDKYAHQYCSYYNFTLPPGHELLTHAPTHPGLYTTTRMMGILQVDPACRREEANILPAYFARGTKVNFTT